ncbi:EamA family transporter [Pseudokordiimonas caeni]|uniref:EamA family transporter n=1 Tax=Pseudokordiimonas caeni TaxID=2997908 RepID=UPI0028113484|nr:EamA family transporter [Pseudokordiimonas caeni]
MTSKPWLLYALVTMVFWGLWGAFAGVSSEHGFPETLVYCVWAVTMVPPAIWALSRINWQLQYDARSIVYGCIIGFLGSGGQMVLFHAVKTGPAYLIFPVISLSPIVTIVLSFFFLKERTTKLGLLGIILALVALPLFDYSGTAGAGDYGSGWYAMALIVLGAWGVQAFFMKLSNESMHAESIFFYMMITGLALIPVALMMTDFSAPIDWGWGMGGPYFAAMIQILNSIGALCLVYAFRFGKAMVVSPMTNAGAPLTTAILSLALLGVVPGGYRLAGIVLALLAAGLLAAEPEDEAVSLPEGKKA